MTNEEVRSFDLTNWVGREVELKCGHLNDKKTDQYVSYSLDEKSYSGWAGRVVGEKDEIVKRTIKDAYLIEGNNGGRGSWETAKTYKEFFNETRKQRIFAKRGAGIMGALLGGGGDPERADIVVKFEEGEKVESLTFDIQAPSEWYSEQYQDAIRKKLVNGYFDSAHEAITYFKTQASDDLFGERYFPVAVFDEGVQSSSLHIPKSVSKRITVDGKDVYGARCKPHEYEDFIVQVYEDGGKIIQHTTWDW